MRNHSSITGEGKRI